MATQNKVSLIVISFMILNKIIIKLSFIYCKSIFEEQKFRPNSPQLSDVTPIGGIITKRFQYAKGETRDIPMGNIHVWVPILALGYKKVKINCSCSSNNKNVATLTDQHYQQLISNSYFWKKTLDVFCKERSS